MINFVVTGDDMRRCAGIIAIWNDRLLLVRGRHSGKWGFPKGRRFPHESEWECAHREFQEETGLIIPSGWSDSVQLPWARYWVYPLSTAPAKGARSPDPREVLDVRWLAPAQLRNMRRRELTHDVWQYLGPR